MTERPTDLGRVLGLVVLVVGLWLLARGLVHREWRDRSWELGRGGAVAALGLLLAAFPDQLLSGTLAIGAAGLLVVSVVGVALSLDPRHGPVRQGQVWRLFLSWLGSRYDPDEGLVDELADKLLFGPPWQAGQLWRYAILMVLAAGISSRGSSPTPPRWSSVPCSSRR